QEGLDIGFLGDQHPLLLRVEEAEDCSAEGMPDLAHDLHADRPTRRYPANGESVNSLSRRRTREPMLVWRLCRDIDRRARARFRIGHRRERRQLTDVSGDGCRFSTDAEVLSPACSRLRLPLLDHKETKERKDAPTGSASHRYLPIW